MFTKDYADVFAGDERWRALSTPTGDTFAWDPESTYVRKPPYFESMPAEPGRSRTSRAPACSPCSVTR
jgi:aconitate hydratase